MKTINTITNTIKNLLMLQKVFGYGTVKAQHHYNLLKEQNLINEPIGILVTKLKTDDKSLMALKNFNTGFIDKVLNDCIDNNIDIIPICCDDYPEILKNIFQPPLILFVKGKLPDFDNNPSICIVGPRKSSEYGKKAAFSLGYRMAKAGMIVVSGGALGCDSQVHRGALRANGKTVAVLGCGLLNDYLPQNMHLRQEISKNNCIISEFPPYAPVTKYSFPIRNRILSGLCDATVVVEASMKSGALSTARHTTEQGREVFVIPGNPSLECYKGSNNLLRDGAHPLIDSLDIFNEYLLHYPDRLDIQRAFEKEECIIKKDTSKNNKNFQKKSTEGLSKEAKIVYNNLNKQQFTADEIFCENISDDDMLSALTELEIEHYIKAIPGGSYIII